jgi:site-specific DNA-methyltransferase (adenine-specific)
MRVLSSLAIQEAVSRSPLPMPIKVDGSSPTRNVYSGDFKDSVCCYDALPLTIRHLANKQNKIDGLALLAQFPDSSVPAIFFDPQYRGIMDKLEYGNEGARQKGRATLEQMSESTIHAFILEINRALKDSGHLFLWVDKFHFVEGITPWLKDTHLETVDLLTWDKERMGMGYRTRRRSEYLVILQKHPKRAKGCWTLHNIPDVWTEKVARGHPHAKPEHLQAALIKAVVPKGDFVVDPASGGYSVMRAALSVGRHFIGGDVRG